MCNGFVRKFQRIAAVVTNAVKELGKFLVKLLEENFRRISVGKCHTQITAVNIYPVFQRDRIGHLETKLCCVKHKPFVRVRSNRFYVVKHRQMNIGSSDECGVFILNQSVHYQSVNFIGMSSSCSKFGKRNAQFCQMLAFFHRFGNDFFVGLPFQMVHLIMQLTDQCQERNFPKNRSVPEAFDGDFEFISMLFNLHFRRVVMKTFQKIEIGKGKIGAGDFEIFLFVFREFQFCHCIDRFSELLCKTFRKLVFAAVDEFVFYNFVGEEFYHCILHGDFIKVIIQNRIQPNFAHKNIVYTNLRNFVEEILMRKKITQRHQTFIIKVLYCKAQSLMLLKNQRFSFVPQNTYNGTIS